MRAKPSLDHHDREVTHCRDRPISLAIVQVNATYKDSPTVRHVANLVHYRDKEARVITTTSLLALRTSRTPSFESFLSSVDVRKLIMETQAKPLTSGRRRLSLITSSSAKSPLSDTQLDHPILQHLKIPKLTHMIQAKGIHTTISIISRTSCRYMRISNYIASFFPVTFQGKAIDCYARLPPKSINSWLDFCHLFIDWFRYSVVKENTANLYQYRQ